MNLPRRSDPTQRDGRPGERWLISHRSSLGICHGHARCTRLERLGRARRIWIRHGGVVRNVQQVGAYSRQRIRWIAYQILVPDRHPATRRHRTQKVDDVLVQNPVLLLERTPRHVRVVSVLQPEVVTRQLDPALDTRGGMSDNRQITS